MLLAKMVGSLTAVSVVSVLMSIGFYFSAANGLDIFTQRSHSELELESPALAESTDTEVAALLDFKANVRDPAGALENWNATTEDLCKWTGVICGSRGNVVRLNLTSRKLDGVISPALGSLSSLLSIELSYNNFTGSLPPEIGNCSNLRKIHVGYNRLTGALPSSLGSLRELKSLSLRDNLIFGSIPVSLLTNNSKLRVLDLSQNLFSGGLPQEIGNMQLLQGLKLQQNNFSGSIGTFLRNCSSLVYLYLSSNQLSGNVPSDLWLPYSLLSLRLSGNKLSGSISSIPASSPGLVELDLSKNDFNGSIPLELGRLSALTTLYLYRNAISGTLPGFLGNATSLQLLDISWNRLTGSIPAQLGQLFQLQHLSLLGNKFTGEIPQSLGNCSSLLSLDLSNNVLHGSIPSNVILLTGIEMVIPGNHTTLSGPRSSLTGSNQGLQVIYFSDNLLTGVIPSDLSNGSAIRFLDFGHNQLTGSIPEKLGLLSSLRTLLFNGNQLTGSIPREFDSLRSVQVIDLSYNYLSGNIPSSLVLCKDLRRLDVSNNHLDGPIPENFEHLQSLQYLNVSNNDLQGPIPSTGVFRNLTSASFFGNAGLCGTLVGRLCSTPSGSSCTGLNCGRWIVVLAVGSFLLALAGAIAIILIRRSVGSGARRGGTYRPSSAHDVSSHRRQFSAAELNSATNHFLEENIVGSGATGTVYRGVMPDGLVIAVKLLRTDPSEKEVGRLLQDLKVLKRVRHPHLLSILGECLSAELNALVFEFMANGSLEKHLHGTGGCLLGWDQRLNIAVGVAQGLVYLHSECHDQVIHGDLKSSNVLLDLKLEAKVADFGLAAILLSERSGKAGDFSVAARRAAAGYTPPEYAATSTPSIAGDIYSFGVLLLELTSAQRPTSLSFGEGVNLVTFASAACKDQWESLLDNELLSELPSKARGIKLFLQIALLCINDAPSERPPSMKMVLEFLQLIQRHSSSDRISASPLRASPTTELPALDTLNARFAEFLQSSSGRSSNPRPSTTSRLSSSPSLPHSNELRAAIDQNLHPDPECHEP